MGFQSTQDFNSGLYVWKFNSLAFFPKIVSDILSFLPFSSLIYTPVMIIVGKYDASQILQALLLQFFWLIVMVGLSQLIWKRVQSFITIQGG